MVEPAEQVVGPVVGPQSSGSATATVGFTPDGTAWSYAIGGLPFMDATSDDRPYARETADFRKEQIDQSRLVGDQSLSGFWTRAQLSFHKGAGVTFYEVTDGETVIDRFTDARNVDVWTPGEVTLLPPTEELSNNDCAYGYLFDDGFATISSAGSVKSRTFAGTPTDLPSTTADPFTWLTSDGINLYGAVEDRIEKCEPGGSFAVLWTHGTRDLSQVFWAKSRLWVIDESGEWYTLAGVVGGTFDTGDGNSLWVGSGAATGWSCADSPGGVFFAVQNRIYETTLDADEPTVPAVVASLGAHETIGTIGAYLGYLVVASSVGIRMGRIGGSSQLALALGDVIVECDASACKQLAYRDSLALVTGTVGTDTLLYEVNVLDQVEDLSGAYAPVRDVGSNLSVHSSLVFPDERVVTMSEDGVNADDDAGLDDATGYVTTGFHRFGTLELKDFRTVSVFARGEAGSIAVTLVRRDGTEFNLVTLGAAYFGGNEISLNLPALTDYVGLKFTLSADDGDAPTLLGYQLRAMPAPTRHRFIQVPLMCFDTEQVGKVERGRRGWAWERLSALEDMERTSGVVRYQDFGTGESAQVLIERVQFQKRTPQRGDKSGFGGFIMLTMRKVA